MHYDFYINLGGRYSILKRAFYIIKFSGKLFYMKYMVRRDLVLKIKVTGRYGTQFQVEINGINRDMRPFSFPNDSFTLLNAELNSRQLMERTSLKGLALPPQRSDIK
jgi:hypothetical protein